MAALRFYWRAAHKQVRFWGLCHPVCGSACLSGLLFLYQFSLFDHLAAFPRVTPAPSRTCSLSGCLELPRAPLPAEEKHFMIIHTQE